MSRTFTYFIGVLFAVTFLGCGDENHNETTETNKSRINKLHPGMLTKSAVTTSLKDTIVLKESQNENDIIVNEYLTERLKPIRKNFKRINSITNWTSTSRKDLRETTEGGEATFYYANGVLEKIVTRHFGETFQQLSEYYLLSGQLSFVFEKSYKYNRSMYYDSIAMKENNDTEAFDFEKSEVIEDRSYFEKGKLIHQLSNQDCGSPFADDYLLEEQKSIKTYFDKLVEFDTK